MRFTYEHDESLSDDALTIMAVQDGLIEWPFKEDIDNMALHHDLPYDARMERIFTLCDLCMQTLKREARF